MFLPSMSKPGITDAGELRLRQLATVWAVGALLAGTVAATMWFRSTRAWSDHLAAAHEAGFLTFEALRTGADPGLAIQINPLAPAEAVLAEKGQFDRLTGAPKPAYVTQLSLKASDAGIQIGVVSDVLQYPVADIRADSAVSAPAQLADLTRLFATYCSEPVLFARYGNGNWQRVDGRQVWGCAAAPRDLRLGAAIVAVLALAVILTHAGNTAAAFDAFAKALRGRRRLGGPESYEATGPSELRDIVNAVNTYLEAEREQLANRAVVLSSVSHDLGTPATRLRLRAALIEDSDLRDKLEHDIDTMTGIIESILTYTRAEMSSEAPRKLSLTSLLEAIADDYRDVGKSVTLSEPEDVIVEGGRSVFMSRRGHGVLSSDRQVIVTGRPIALERAITNLVDNALKYGRRATIGLETDANSATVLVKDEGSDKSAKDVEALLAPFKRGDNTAYVDGHGLGLTIVATIANLHGGSLSFVDTAAGLCARFEIQRN